MRLTSHHAAPLVSLAVVALAGCSALTPPAPARLDAERAHASPAQSAASSAAASAPAEREAQAQATPGGSDHGSAPPADAADAAPSFGEGRSVLFAVHVASYRSEAAATRGWAVLRSASPDAFAGLEPRVEQVDLGARGVFLRLKAGPLSNRAEAEARCAALQRSGYYCQIVDFTGQALLD